jgi:hypothetical protein
MKSFCCIIFLLACCWWEAGALPAQTTAQARHQQDSVAIQQLKTQQQQLASQVQLLTSNAGGGLTPGTDSAQCGNHGVRIVDIYSVTNRHPDRLRLDDQVVVRVLGLHQELVRLNGLRNQMQPNNSRPNDLRTGDLRLYVDDIMLPIPPTAIDMRLNCDTADVRFHLVRDTTTEATWQLFYHVPGKYEHPAHIGLGLTDGQLAEPYPARPDHIMLELIRPRLLLLGLLLIAAFLGFIGWLAFRTNLLRNDWSNQVEPNPNALPGQPIPVFDPQYRNASFSLAKTQMALWTVLIISAYLMIYMVTGELPYLTTGLLALLGISLAHGWLSKVINHDQDERVAYRHQDQLTQGFFTDIVTDDKGVSIARLQFIAFNVIAALYFVRYVLKQWALPDFDSQLLALLGVSSASMLALKTQENAQATQQAPVAPNPANGLNNPDVAGPDPADPNAGVVPPATPANPAGPAVDADGTPTRRDDEDDNSDPSGPDADSPADAGLTDPNRAI